MINRALFDACEYSRASFQGIRAGDMIDFKDRDGKIVRAKVNPMLIFSGHVIVKKGNNGTIVNSENFVRIAPKRGKSQSKPRAKYIF
jgi:hypothetical protein